MAARLAGATLDRSTNEIENPVAVGMNVTYLTRLQNRYQRPMQHTVVGGEILARHRLLRCAATGCARICATGSMKKNAHPALLYDRS